MNELATIQGQNQLTAIDAAHAASNRSSKYGFISSRAIIDSLVTEGFSIRKVDIQRTKDETKQGFQRHIVRLQHQSLLPKQVGDYFPEILLMNSHDGSSALRMTLGLFRLVCSNGMVSGSTTDEIRFAHRQISLPAIQGGIMRLVEGSGRITDAVDRMGAIHLNQSQMKEFAERAIALRYENPNGNNIFQPTAEDLDKKKKETFRWENRLNSVTRILRPEDNENTLWNFYNRVQENLTQGIQGGGIRRITAPLADLSVNRDLWNIAESYLN
jgi:hypothetical protein